MIGLAERLQMFLRHTAHLQYPSLSLTAFTLFLHPTNPSLDSNYALPDTTSTDDLAGALGRLRQACASRDRLPRIMFVEGYAPHLAAGLHAHGFVESARAPLLICTVETLRPPQAPLGLTVAILDERAADWAVRAHLEVHARGFEPLGSESFNDEEVQRFRRDLGIVRAFTAYLDGVPVAAAASLPPYGGVAEIVGITTLVPFRRQGIGGALAAAATRQAFGGTVDTVFLIAADQQAGRVYARVGFQAGGTLLTYDDKGTSVPPPGS